MEVGMGNGSETRGVAMEFPVFDGAELASPPTVPPRLRRRLTETKASTSPSSVEEIEAKLRNADLRRQKFYENLSSKARPKQRSPQSADELNRAQRLEAKLQAAEQKRMQIHKAHSQRRATLRERTSQSLLRTSAPQSKYKEHVNAAICQKRASAKKNRLELLEADKKKTTLELAKNYHLLNINASHEKLIPFEHFANLIETSSTLRTTKALLDRLETRYKVLLGGASGTSFYGQVDISHLLQRVVLSSRAGVKLSRYQPRIVLSAYMILGHPDAVFSGQGVRETALAKSAKEFVQEFELLIDIILNGPSHHCTFRSQLAAFDAAWCSYLNSFVVWKVKDVESLEEDLVRAACQMEISMIKKYKPTLERDNNDITHDVKVFQKQMQVTEHQKLLREKMLHLSGEAGIKRLQDALFDTRKKVFQSKEKSGSVEPPVTHIPSSCSLSSPSKAGPHERSDSVPHSRSEDDAAVSALEDIGSSIASGSGLVHRSDEMVGMENVFIVNEFLHGQRYSFADGLNITDGNKKVRETMKKAFWDGIYDSIQQERYDHVVALMKEVRDELCEMSPQSRKQEIHEVIDLDVLSQLLSSDRLDMKYLGTIMEFALVSLQKLSAVANENQLKESHRKVVSELAALCQAGDGSNRSHAKALIKGLQFVLEQIQELKQEISKARIKILEPLLKGPTGLEYLEKAFVKIYGPPSDALVRLPLTMQWLSSVAPEKHQEWNEHKRALSELPESSASVPFTALKTGGSFSSRLQTSATLSLANIADNQYTVCKGDKGDLLVRLGLLKLVNNINGMTQEELPETLKLNFLRLRAVQAQLQKITVIATSILVLRQILLMEQMISSSEDMDNTILRCSTELSRILDTVKDAGLEELVEVLSKTTEGLDKANDSTKTESRRLVMARMLRKSVQAGDPIFVKVSRAVYLATRVVVGGGGNHGRELAEKALRQVGGSVLTDMVVEPGRVLGVMARVSENVHGPWYARLVENM